MLCQICGVEMPRIQLVPNDTLIHFKCPKCDRLYSFTKEEMGEDHA